MKKICILLIAFGLLMLGVMDAEAATDGTVAVTVAVTQSLEMTVSPSAWAAGTMNVLETKTTWLTASAGYFTVTNTGNGTSYMDIRAAITGGCSIGGTAGANIYRIGHGQATGTPPTTVEPVSYAAISGADTDLATILASGTYRFDLQLKSPTSTTHGGVTQTITVTITAKAA